MEFTNKRIDRDIQVLNKVSFESEASVDSKPTPGEGVTVRKSVILVDSFRLLKGNLS